MRNTRLEAPDRVEPGHRLQWMGGPLEVAHVLVPPTGPSGRVIEFVDGRSVVCHSQDSFEVWLTPAEAEAHLVAAYEALEAATGKPEFLARYDEYGQSKDAHYASLVAYGKAGA